jgi:two-component system OmpR family sensor kinase
VVAARIDRMPLRARLVVVITVLVAAGLVLAGVTSTALLHRSLVAQIDDKLRLEGRTLASRQLANLQSDLAAVGPSDYYVRLQVGTLEIPWASSSALARYGTPNVPDMDAADAVARDGEPFTVTSSVPGSRWRVIAFATDADGSVVVALPLAEATSTTSTMIAVLVLSGVGIVLLGGLAAGWAVRRSLAPLSAIEGTAAAIAAGDLSRRVPVAPPSTEVGRLGLALNGMLAQIERAFAERSASEARMRRFVADASHELRTPLATIRGYTELHRLGGVSGPDEVADTMRRIEDSATRMGALVEDLLVLARLDEGRPMRREPVDLTVLAADAISDLRALDPARPARLEALDGGPIRPVVVTGDDARVRQVLANLVGNVVRHTPPGTPVEIAVGTTDGHGVVEVRDHGPGIDAEHAARVFERFYRVDSSRTRQSGGSGLGLAIVASIVAALGGTVGLAATAGGGATVRVALPAAPPAPQAEAADDEDDADDEAPGGQTADGADVRAAVVAEGSAASSSATKLDT